MKWRCAERRVQGLRDALLQQGEDSATKELDDTITSFWTTSSELLGEIKESLIQVRPIAERQLGEEFLTLLDNAVSGADRLLND
jgi:hypothetical protein